ncbi:uncharacterized protein FOMMEDRAFT_88861 [Fomitiporia mediterranea MF3/22]|uniref:uncharacterized protein n=1 Tax=Fomitiporia mediterranea (strain MF3/22) TaxID=694068 RepID=UPI0004408281|nr:uncharacterized protein FOMMEDRAFT_88861 [Fomitiporia mediterranea MF3/22]EJD01199.1 hypothetical protein FOMMEDRAFT_88861 [Fomitiporia mediterranea MF3/22]
MGDTDNDVARHKSINRSPSVAPPSMRNGMGNAGSVTPPDLEQKVGRLADLLPHADRKVLEGYLRRAGGMDMVAIGRYLDDEKNGLLIRD